jgi:hypothetical protein
MTITTNDTRNEYTATASQTVFNYTFKIFAAGDLNVYQTASGVTPTDSDLITTYTVDAGTIGDASGGFITLDSGATLNDQITIVSNIDDSRTTDYQNNGDFVPDTVNDDFDRVVSLVKQNKNIVDRTPQFDEAVQNATGLSWAAPTAGEFIRWKADLTGLESISLNTSEDATNAAAVSYDNSTSGLTGTDLQATTDELDGTIDNLNTLSGVAKDATNLGTFTGSTITDNVTNKTALQELETALEATDDKPWQLISTTATTAAASIDITLDSATYKTFRLEFEIGSSLDADFTFTLGHTGGTVFYTGATDYGFLRTTTATPNRHDQALVNVNISTDAAAKLNGEIHIFAADTTTSAARYKAFYSFENTSAAQVFCDISGVLNVATGTAVDAIKLTVGAGTFDTGDSIKLYGLKA